MPRKLRLLGLCLGLMIATSTACGPIRGQNPKPLLGALQRDPALGLVPPGSETVGPDTHADSGTVAATSEWAYNTDPTSILTYFRAHLPDLGWHRDDSRTFVAGERFLKNIAGKEAHFDLIDHPDRHYVETSAWMTYREGLLG